VHNLLPHRSYVSTLPDITQKPKSCVAFLSVVCVARKRAGFGGSEVALKRAGCAARSQWVFEVISLVRLHMHTAAFAAGEWLCR